jgi:hypothetical protein
MAKCNCSNYCFVCVSQHSAFVDLVWSITEKATEFVYDEAQKKTGNELWQDDTNAPQQMENAINEAVANVLFNSMTPVEISNIIENRTN